MTHPTWLEEVKARLKAATPGPWKYHKPDKILKHADGYPLEDILLVAETQMMGLLEADAKLIANAPSDLTRAISEIEEMEKRIAELERHKRTLNLENDAWNEWVKKLESQLSDRDKAIAGLEAKLDSVCICPACATAFSLDSMVTVGAQICLERNSLKGRVDHLESLNAKYKKALEFYAGDVHSDIEIDVFNHIHRKSDSVTEFDSDWLCGPARAALEEGKS